MLPNFNLSYYNFFIPYPEREIFIIYNSFANSMIQVDWETGSRLQHLNSMEIHHLPIETIELLKKNRMIIADDFNEFAELKKEVDKKRTSFDNDETLFILFSPTNMCNMSCPYCYQGDKSAETLDEKYLSKENIEAIKKFVLNRLDKPHSTPIKKVYVEWFGGEPLMQKNIIEELSKFILEQVDLRNLEYKANIITNGYLLDEATWILLEKCRISHLQITIDGNKEMHDRMRHTLNSKGSYEAILNNLSKMPKDKFNVTVRINGDKDVFKHLPELFDDMIRRGLWPQQGDQLNFHWAPKFFNFLGFNQEKNIYYTSYEYQKSKEEFAKLRLEKFNNWAVVNGKKSKNLKIGYPKYSEFYCNTVESPNSFSLDSSGYIHKCYNTVNNKERRIQHISEFEKHDERFEHYKKLDKTSFYECKTCKVFPICEESCNMRMLDKAESKICTAWKFFMNDRMKAIYDQQFAEDFEKKEIETVIDENLS